MVTIKHGVNVDGPYYDPKQAENYRKNAIIGGIAAGIMLVLIIMLWIVSNNCRKDRDKETSTVYLSLEGDQNPGQDSVEIVTGEIITDGRHLAGTYETVEEGTTNQNASASATSDNIEVVHESIGSAGYSTVETVSENRSNAHELDLTSSNINDLQSKTTVEDEADVEEDKQDESENNINFQGEGPGNNEEVIPPADTILEENGVTEIGDLIFNPLEAEPGLEKKKDQLIPLIESTVSNNPTDLVSMVRCDVDEIDGIQGLLNMDNIEVERKERSKGPSSRHGSDHKENVIIQDGVVIIQKNEESTKNKIKETFDTKKITSDILENHIEIEMNAGEDKRDGGNGSVLPVSMSNENLEADTATLEPSGMNERLISELPLQDALGYTDSQDFFGIVAGSEMSNRQTTE
ncbi:hypothetical protein ACJMK2_030997 [Sinanodonta woodiana]|uniref:Uncharacterized protein n=1 Tax=Sinanodonta woodiana TaxID=1069815 RepID=A0ABD3WZ69_SINWO